MLGGVRLQAAQGARPPCPALVEDHYPPEIRVEKPAVHRASPRSWPAMQEQHRPAPWVAHLLPVHDMSVGQRQIACLERADFREEVAAGHGVGCYRRSGMGKTGINGCKDFGSQ